MVCTILDVHRTMTKSGVSRRLRAGRDSQSRTKKLVGLNGRDRSHHASQKTRSGVRLAVIVVTLPLIAGAMILGISYYHFVNRAGLVADGPGVVNADHKQALNQDTPNGKSIPGLPSSTVQQQASQPATVHYHIVFSTSCTIYQDWQSYLVRIM
jgi:hypothetical protein